MNAAAPAAALTRHQRVRTAKFHGGCSAEAIGQVRLFTNSLAAPHDKLIGSTAKVGSRLLTDFCFKKNVGLQRAQERMCAILGPPTIRYDRTWLYRTLRYRDSPVTGQDGQGVEVAAVVVGDQRGGPGIVDCPYGLYFTTHALGRLWERSSLPRVSTFEFGALILEAHRNLLAMPTATWNAANERADAWVLPAADGGFYISVQVIKDALNGDAVPFVIAKSWVTKEMLFPEERAAAAAVLYPGEYPIGDGLLTPAPLRGFASIKGGKVQLPRENRL